MSGHTANTRRDRRAAERAARKQKLEKIERRPVWASPMMLLTVGAVVIGLVIAVSALIASGAFSSASPLQTPSTAAAATELVHGRSLGNPAAPVKIDVWADYQCPVCKRMTDQVEPLLVSKWVANGTVSFTFRDLAFIGQESLDAAVAARYSEAKGPGFWPMHDLLYANQGVENKGGFSRQRLGDMAVKLGMDRAGFLSGLDDKTYIDAVNAENSAGNALGISQTPTLVVNGSVEPGLPDWTTLSSQIAQLAAAASPSPAPAGSPAPTSASPAP